MLYFSVAFASADSLADCKPYLHYLDPRGKDVVSDKPSITSWYISPGVFFGIHARPGNCLAATAILSNDWGLGFSVKRADYKAKNLPATYSGGLEIFGDNTPHDHMEFNSLVLIRQFRMPNRRMRLGLEAGPAWVRSITKDFVPVSPRPGSWFDYGPNYETSNSYKENIGLSLRARMAIPLARIMSAEFALFGNINSIKSVAGAEICLNFGRIRNKKNQPVHL